MGGADCCLEPLQQHLDLLFLVIADVVMFNCGNRWLSQPQEASQPLPVVDFLGNVYKIVSHELLGRTRHLPHTALHSVSLSVPSINCRENSRVNNNWIWEIHGNVAILHVQCYILCGRIKGTARAV